MNQKEKPSSNTQTTAALIILSPHLLATTLQLPPTINITGATFDTLTHTLTLRIDGPGLPPLSEGAVPPAIPLAEIAEIDEGKRQ